MCYVYKCVSVCASVSLLYVCDVCLLGLAEGLLVGADELAKLLPVSLNPNPGFSQEGLGWL